MFALSMPKGERRHGNKLRQSGCRLLWKILSLLGWENDVVYRSDSTFCGIIVVLQTISSGRAWNLGIMFYSLKCLSLAMVQVTFTILMVKWMRIVDTRKKMSMLFDNYNKLRLFKFKKKYLTNLDSHYIEWEEIRSYETRARLTITNRHIND